MTKKTKLIPFDYERYKAGAKAVTENGINVYDIHLFECNHAFPLIGIIDNFLMSWNKEGKANSLNNYALMLEVEVEEKTFYVNVYQGFHEVGMHPNLERAKNYKSSDCLGTLKVTYTEEDLIK